MRILFLLALFAELAVGEPVHIGSKSFTEGFLLGELAAQTLEDSGFTVVRHLGMGGTGILFQAIQNNEIQIYPEYSSTISEAILKRPEIQDIPAIREALKPLHLTVSSPLGFKNLYALAVRRDFATAHNLKSISDLEKLNLRAAFSNEFMTRADGYRGLIKKYPLKLGSPRSVEHSLAFEALDSGKADLIDVYTTEAKLQKFDLVTLEDDRNYFPKGYEALWLAREDFVQNHPTEWNRLTQLEGKLDEETIRKLNAKVDLEHFSFKETIRQYLHPENKISQSEGFYPEILLRTKQHLFLVFTSVLLACVVGIPLGILAAYHERTGQAILLISGILQTIPSLALLCFLIPLFGIGTKSALVALFLYSLLPTVLNTYTGMKGIDANLIQVSRALGLTWMQRLRLIEVPLALPNIIAGVRTSTVIGIGTATLAALIGAGGYGVLIVTGLAINDIPTILTGAIPAALMALAAHFGFSWLTRMLLPHGLR